MVEEDHLLLIDCMWHSSPCKAPALSLHSLHAHPCQLLQLHTVMSKHCWLYYSRALRVGLLHMLL
jgi:hypothetical protein